VDIEPECRSGQLWFNQVALADGAVYLRWGKLFEFLVSADGHRIECHRLMSGSFESLSTYLLGQVLSFAFVTQGLEPLHATVVVAGSTGIGLLGASGDGKSTLAAAFLRAGYPILTDDLLVLRQSSSGYQAYPGPPRIKLFPETAKMLLGDTMSGVLMNDASPKMIFPLKQSQYHPFPASLAALYVLSRRKSASEGCRVRIRNLSGRHAYLALSRHCFNRRIQDRERLRRQFLAASELAARIPIRLISYPGSIAALPAVREAVLADIAG
jgi:hypothetical protein